MMHVSHFLKGIGMAAKSVTVADNMEIQWIAKSLQTQRDSLLRSRGKEMTGSDIWNLRGKELEVLNQLIVRFS